MERLDALAHPFKHASDQFLVVILIEAQVQAPEIWKSGKK
jgi:hypothetical protein